MDKLALVIAAIALLIGGIGYWRSGGAEDVAVARDKLETAVEKLEATQREIVDDVSTTMRSVYEGTQVRMQRFADSITETRKEAGEALAKQLDRASQQLAALQRGVADGLASIKDTTLTLARQTQDSLVRRVNRMEARVAILQARWKIDKSVELADKLEFDSAERKLQEAVMLIKDARQALGEDGEYEAKLDAMRDSLEVAVSSVKAKAENIRAKIDQVISDTDKLVAAFESNEQLADDEQKAKGSKK